MGILLPSDIGRMICNEPSQVSPLINQYKWNVIRDLNVAAHLNTQLTLPETNIAPKNGWLEY